VGCCLRTLAVLALLATCAFGSAVRNPLFTVRERQRKPATVSCFDGLIEVALSYSELTVFNDGQATQVAWVVPACSNPAQAWEWTPPPGSKIRRFKLVSGEYEQLKGFLDSREVRALTSFMNAGPGVADYEIKIHRLSGVQTVPVVSLMPNHFELRCDPTLLRLICKAKNIAGDERPAWCMASSF
jgi:hypothetical protein